MASTITYIEYVLMSKIADLKKAYGEDVELTQSELDVVATALDEVNESWNDNLDLRPTT